jgi:hypothetical protein
MDFNLHRFDVRQADRQTDWNSGVKYEPKHVPLPGKTGGMASSGLQEKQPRHSRGQEIGDRVSRPRIKVVAVCFFPFRELPESLNNPHCYSSPCTSF